MLRTGLWRIMEGMLSTTEGQVLIEIETVTARETPLDWKAENAESDERINARGKYV